MMVLPGKLPVCDRNEKTRDMRAHPKNPHVPLKTKRCAMLYSRIAATDPERLGLFLSLASMTILSPFLKPGFLK